MKRFVVCIALTALAAGTARAEPPAKPETLSLADAVRRSFKKWGFTVADDAGKLVVAKHGVPTLESERDAAQLLLNVEVAYWNVYGSRKQVDGCSLHRDAARELLHQVEHRRDAGKATDADVEQARRQYDGARKTLAEAKKENAENERQLMMFTGAAVANGASVLTDTPSRTPYWPGLKASTAEAVSARAELRMARASENLALLTWLAYRAYGLATGRAPAGMADVDRAVAFAVQVRKDNEKKAESFLVAYSKRLSLNWEQIRANTATHEAYAEQLKTRRKEWLAGRGTLDILLEAQRFQADADNSVSLSVRDYNNAIAGFAFSKGAALKRHGVTVAARK